MDCIQVLHWLKQLCEELSERLVADLDQNKRIAHTLTLHVRAYKVDAQFRLLFPCLLEFALVPLILPCLYVFVS